MGNSSNTNSVQTFGTVNIGTIFKGSKSGKAVEAKGEDVSIEADSVVIDLVYGGLCGTDLHYKNADMVLGHEPVGVVSQVGPSVNRFKKGDRVGFGYCTGTCGHCSQCFSGNDVTCPERRMYGAPSGRPWQGAFGDKAVVPEAFVHRIPDKMSLADAAPLQCAGATVFSALVNADAKPWEHIGIIGVGGLGHLAIQFARAFGAEVTVFSQTDRKREEATKLGAHNFVSMKDTPDVSKIGLKPIDHLVVSSSVLPEWKSYLPALAPRASIIPLSVDNGNIEFPNMGLIGNELRIIGSLVASRQVHRNMLEFAALHSIKPMTERLPLTEAGLNEAMERLDKGDVRYRFVLENQANKGKDSA